MGQMHAPATVDAIASALQGRQGGESVAALVQAYAEGKLKLRGELQLEHGWSVGPRDTEPPTLVVRGPGLSWPGLMPPPGMDDAALAEAGMPRCVQLECKTKAGAIAVLMVAENAKQRREFTPLDSALADVYHARGETAPSAEFLSGVPVTQRTRPPTVGYSGSRPVDEVDAKVPVRKVGK